MTRERQLTDAFVELTDTLVGDFDVVDLLHQLTMRCVRLLDVDAAGLLLADRQGRLRPMAASTEQARMLKLLALHDVDGPGLDCYRTGEPVTSADLVAEGGRWPRFAAAAQLTGFVAVQALPMRHHDRVIGALTLLQTAPGRRSQPMTRLAGIGLVRPERPAESTGHRARRQPRFSDLGTPEAALGWSESPRTAAHLTVKPRAPQQETGNAR